MDELSLGEVSRLLHRLDGRGYKAYNELRGIRVYCSGLQARFTRIQGDPYATPSILEAHISLRRLGVASKLYRDNAEAPFTDHVARRLYRASYRRRRRCGSGHSCYLGYPRPGPHIIRRSSVELHGDVLTLRIHVGLPAAGRRILGLEASRLLEDACRVFVEAVSLDEEELRGHVSLFLDQEYLRGWLRSQGYMFFVADGSILPRESSISDKPLRGAVPFRSPPSLKREVLLPSGRRISGMAVPRGIMVVTGGGYHGKTTLLESVQDGIYNHVAGDGREYVVSLQGTVSVKAEDGRLVHSVDISGLISELPERRDTSNFSSMDASGSTSMAASISEALEAGAEVILVDEDTSASNLLYKDSVMERLVPDDPIKQLSQLAFSMSKKLGVGLIVISGASSAFLAPADHVVVMRKYVPSDITREAKAMASPAVNKEYKPPRPRTYRGVKGLERVRARGSKLVARYRDGTIFELDTRDNPRIVEEGQVRMLARIIEKIVSPLRPLGMRELAETVDKALGEKGFKAYAHPVPPDLTWVSGIDVVWVVNRLYGSDIVLGSSG